MSQIKLITSSNVEIPLKYVKINMSILNNISTYTLTQNYVNTEKAPLEVMYVFPTPLGTIIYDFMAIVNDKEIKAVLKPKEQARNDYNDAINKGDSGYLLEEIDGNVFSICLGNIAPGAQIYIIIKCVSEIKTETNCTQLRINVPLSIMPRYTPLFSESSSEKSDLVNPEKIGTKPYDLQIYGSIELTDPLISLDAKTCKIQVSNMKEKGLNFEITKLENLNEDVILTIKRQQPKIYSLIERMNDDCLKDESFRYTTMVNLVPNFEIIPQVNVCELNYTIILDRSGSMQGNDLKNCKAAANLFIASLPIGASFDVYHFGSDFEKFRLSSDITIGTLQAKEKAINWINDIECDGGTEVLNVLKDVYNTFRSTGKNGIILFLSDGGVSNTDQVKRLVFENKNIPMFTIGIGNNVSQDLIQSMADLGQGRAEFINSNNDEIKDKVVAQLNRAKQKCNRDNKIEVNTYGNYKIVPSVLPPIFENDVSTFYIFSENPLSSITYMQNASPISIPIEKLTIANANYPIHRMAGLKLIDELKNGRQTGSQLTHLQRNTTTDLITSTSLNLNILSEYTSFIAVEVKEENEKIFDQPIIRKVPLQRRYHSYGQGECSMSLFDCPTTLYERMPSTISAYFKSTKTTKYDTDEEMTDASSSSSSSKQYDIKYVVENKLNSYTKLDIILTSNSNELLPFADKVEEGDYIKLIHEEMNNGIYKIVSIGSISNPWVLEKVA